MATHIALHDLHCATAGAVNGPDERSDSGAVPSDTAATPTSADSSTATEAARQAEESAEKAASAGGAEGGETNKPSVDASGDPGKTNSTAASKKPFGEQKLVFFAHHSKTSADSFLLIEKNFKKSK